MLVGRRICGTLRTALFWVTTQRVVELPVDLIFKGQESKKDIFLKFMALPSNPKESTFHFLRGGSLKSPYGRI